MNALSLSFDSVGYGTTLARTFNWVRKTCMTQCHVQLNWCIVGNFGEVFEFGDVANFLKVTKFMKHYCAKASVTWTFDCLGLSTVELAGWYTACNHEVRVWSQASMNWSSTIHEWSNHKSVHYIPTRRITTTFAIWPASLTNHALISWLMSQQKAIKPKAQDNQRESL